MKVAIVFDHPYGVSACDNIPHNRSFCAALLKSVREGLQEAGHEVELLDLLSDGFDPVMRKEDLLAWRMAKTNDSLVQKYHKILFECEHLIFIFPIYWECMPALTKGFLDKVLVKNLLYKQSKNPLSPFESLMPKLSSISMLTTMSTPSIAYKLIFGNPIKKIMFNGTFKKIGIKNLKWYNYSGMENKSLDERRQRLQKTKEIFKGL